MCTEAASIASVFSTFAMDTRQVVELKTSCSFSTVTSGFVCNQKAPVDENTTLTFWFSSDF